jgi:NADPH2 dehydrogenase
MRPTSANGGLDLSRLFSPTTVNGVEFRNRVVMPPMVRELADEDGCVTAELIEEYARRAAAGTGLIIVEATAVEEAGRCWAGGLGAYAGYQRAGLRQLAERIKAEGAVAGIQLVHGGPQAEPAVSGQETVGPSAVAPTHDRPAPRELTLSEIERIQRRFADAAAMVVEAGFELVELHAAHGYLLDSFLMTRRNQRQDAYGGCLENRMRMVVETCQRVRENIGRRALLDCRICVFNKIAEGFGPDDLRTLVAGLQAAGLDLLHLSTEGALQGYFGSDKPLGRWVKEMTGLPLIVAGRLSNPLHAERALAQGVCDFVAVGGRMLRNPDWTREARQVLEA